MTAPGLHFPFSYRKGGQANFWGGSNISTFLCRILQVVKKIVLQKLKPVFEVGFIVFKAEQKQIGGVVIRPIFVSCLEGSRFEFRYTT
jgi:hypothetical protein